VAIHHHIIVDEGDVFVGGHLHPPIAAIGEPCKRLGDVAHPGIGMTQGHVTGLGCRPGVVDHHDLEVRVVAGQDGINRLPEQPPPVAGADHHADRWPERFRFRDGSRKFLDGTPKLVDPDPPLLDADRDKTTHRLPLAHQETGPVIIRSADQLKPRIRRGRCQVAKIKFADPHRAGPLGVVAAAHSSFQHDMTLPEDGRYRPPTQRGTAHGNEGNPR